MLRLYVFYIPTLISTSFIPVYYHHILNPYLLPLGYSLCLISCYRHITSAANAARLVQLSSLHTSLDRNAVAESSADRLSDTATCECHFLQKSEKLRIYSFLESSIPSHCPHMQTHMDICVFRHWRMKMRTDWQKTATRDVPPPYLTGCKTDSSALKREPNLSNLRYADFLNKFS